MANIKRVKLHNSEMKLLEVTAGDLIPILKKNKKLSHVRQSAFGYYEKDSNEFWQVHVIVTRNKSDFLEFLQTEEMTTLNP